MKILRFALSAALLAAMAFVSFAQLQTNQPFTPEIEEFVENFKPGGHDLTGQIRSLAPDESLARLHPAKGYVIELAAKEPVIQQPLDMRFDERGRLWVVQYRQFPFPAGLTVTAYDQYLRAEFDRVPPPPPHHFRGADRIMILEDQDGDGRYETHKNFLEGLNMATSMAFGHGGVWVLQSPYLLFYPDKDGDDVPDGDPEVHLSGFGLEDTSSLASSLHWGPDGWLYGASGSTTNLDVQGVRLLGQGIWRYHPETRRFEVFAEGGGNTMSLEFDKYGRMYSGTNHGATRGLHYAQGATYVKRWSKHGPALNPFLFGHFEHMGHEGDMRRFPQAFLYYEGGLLSDVEGQIVVGMALTNLVQASEVYRDTSTFRTVDSDRLITSDDRAFRPVDVEVGPDGCLYVADWYDVRLTNLNPRDTWDKSTGRIYRIAPAKFVRSPNPDLRNASPAELIDLLSHSNRWYREHARRLLANRPEKIGSELATMLEGDNDAALEALWVLNLRGELDTVLLRRALRHPNEHVRRWGVRLIGDGDEAGGILAAELAILARREQAAEVRSQLASTAKRLPAREAFPIIRELLDREEDLHDKHIPMLIWWAIEAHADKGRNELLEMLRDRSVWRTGIFSEYIVSRIGRRYTADQGPKKYYTLTQGVYSDWKMERSDEYLRRNLETAAQIIALAPDSRSIDDLVAGMTGGLTGPAVDSVPEELSREIERLWATRPHSASLVTLATWLRQPGALPAALSLTKSGNLGPTDLQKLVDLFAETGIVAAIPLIADLLRNETDDRRQGELLSALGGFENIAAAGLIMERFPYLSPRLRMASQRLLSEKPDWARLMLERMDVGAFDAGVLSDATVGTIRRHGDPSLTALLERQQWRRRENAEERVAQKLFDEGKLAYDLNCSACHQQDGQGLTELAPALVGSEWVQEGTDHLVRIVLHGKENPGRGFIMPSLRNLQDGQIAAVLTYVLREFGNQPDMVTAAKVAEIRAVTAGRQQPWSDNELSDVK